MTRKKTPKHEDLELWRRFVKDIKPLKTISLKVGIEIEIEIGVEAEVQEKPKPQVQEKENASSASVPKKDRFEKQAQELICTQSSRIARRPLLSPMGQTPESGPLDQRLKRPKKIDGRLDLHGLTQAQAYDALITFIENAVHQGKKTLLVITGKGSSKGLGQGPGKTQKTQKPLIPGVLRQNLPRWLEAPALKNFILSYGEAHFRDGGPGAFYIILRRKQ